MTVPATLASHPAAALLRDGFAVLDDFVTTDDLAPLCTAVDELLANPLPQGCARPHNTLAPLRWNSPVVDIVLGCRERVARLRDAVGAKDLRWISGYVSVKEPTSAALWWHQDWWCWDHPVTRRPEAAQLAVLIPLVDTSPANGATRVLPRSHHRSTPLHAALPEAHTAEAGDLEPGHVAMADQPGQVTPALRAGDALVADYRLLHGTHPNSGSRRRSSVLLNFAPSWSALPDDVRAHLIRHGAQPGAGERPTATTWHGGLLPTYDGVPRDLRLSRVAPSAFRVQGS